MIKQLSALNYCLLLRICLKNTTKCLNEQFFIINISNKNRLDRAKNIVALCILITAVNVEYLHFSKTSWFFLEIRFFFFKFIILPRSLVWLVPSKFCILVNSRFLMSLA